MNLAKLVKEVSVKIGLGNIPHTKVSVDAHYALTKYGKIIVAPILISCLSEQQLRSVIAHEGYHYRNYWRRLCLHIVFSVAITLLPTLIFVVMLPTLAAVFPPLARFEVTLPLIVVLLVLSSCVSFLILRWKQRRDELRADTLAVRVAGKKSIRQAFRLIYGTPQKHGLIVRIRQLFQTHPCIQKRLENIADAPPKQRNLMPRNSKNHMARVLVTKEI